jgi:DNA-binding transcriptional LysR family regulator
LIRQSNECIPPPVARVRRRRRHGSFTGAAKRLHITQSALSLLIKDLETELGVRLLERTTRTVRLSDVGMSFRPLVHGVLQDLERAVASVADLRDLKRGVARIAAPQLMSLTLLPQVLATHRSRHPGVQARIVECLMEQLEAKVLSGEADLGVGPERTVGPDIELIALMKAPVMLVCPKRHPLATARRVTWKDVVAQPFIAQGGEYSARIDRDLHAWSKDLSLRPTDEVTYLTTRTQPGHQRAWRHREPRSREAPSRIRSASRCDRSSTRRWSASSACSCRRSAR